MATRILKGLCILANVLSIIAMVVGDWDFSNKFWLAAGLFLILGRIGEILTDYCTQPIMTTDLEVGLIQLMGLRVLAACATWTAAVVFLGHGETLLFVLCIFGSSLLIWVDEICG